MTQIHSPGIPETAEPTFAQDEVADPLGWIRRMRADHHLAGRLFPHLVSRRVRLRPAVSSDQPAFFDALLRTGIESFQPASLPPDIITTVNDAAFVITSARSGEVLGFSALFGGSPAGFLKAGVYLVSGSGNLGLGSEAICLTVNYAFASFDIDRVVGQTTEASFDSFGLSLEYLESTGNGAQRDHLWFRGRAWDLHTFSTHRSEWLAGIDAPGIAGMLPAGCSWTAPPAPAGSDTAPQADRS